MKTLMRHLPLMRTCKEAAALMVAQEDRPLPMVERAALNVHLALCKACPQFRNQLLTMKQAMKQWRHYTEDS